MKFIYYIVIITIFYSCSEIKVACVGDSITYGYGIKNRENNSYPAQLQQLLGNKYEVQNFGVNGSTILKKGNKPYWKQKQYNLALDFNPNIVVIMLGTNDAKPINWNAYKSDFKDNYLEMIASFKQLKSTPKIYICLLPPVNKNKWHIQKEVVEVQLKEIITDISKDNKVTLIDNNSIFLNKEMLFPDNVHPNKEGATLIAIEVSNKTESK